MIADEVESRLRGVSSGVAAAIRPDADRIVAVAVPALALLLSIHVRITTWFTRDFTPDDFFLAYLGWIRSTSAAPHVDFHVPNFTPLAEVTSPLFYLLPESFLPLDILRALFLPLSLVLLAQVALVTWKLSGSAVFSVVAAAIVSLQPDVILRIGDLRGDLPAAVALLAAIIALANQNRARTAVFLAGLAATLSLKLVVAVPFVVAVAAVQARGSLRKVAELAAAGASMPAIYLLWRLGADGVTPVRTTFENVGTSVAAGGTAVTHYLERTLETGWWFAAAACVGLAVTFTRSAVTRRLSPDFLYGLCLLAFVTLFVRTNPFIYPYVMVILVPLVAPAVGGLRYLRFPRRPEAAGAVIAVTLTVWALAGSLDALERTAKRTNRVQKAVIEWLWRASDDRTAVFDWQGMHFGRKGVRHWWMFRGLLPRYESGWFTVRDELKRARVAIILENYRLSWMTKEDRAFILRNYVLNSPCTRVAGIAVPLQELSTGAIEFESFVSGRFRLDAPPGEYSVDGRMVAEDVWLSAGVHRIRGRGFDATGGKSVRLAYEPPRLAAAGRVPCTPGQLLVHRF